jgi:hypothetical protein
MLLIANRASVPLNQPSALAAFCPGAFKGKRDKALEYQCDYLLADMPLDILALQREQRDGLLPTNGRHFVSIKKLTSVPPTPVP